MILVRKDQISNLSCILKDIYIYLFNAIHFFSSLFSPWERHHFPKWTKILTYTSLTRPQYHNWIQHKFDLLIHKTQLGFLSFQPPDCLWVLWLKKSSLIIMIKMPGAIIGLSQEVLVHSSFEQRVGMNQQGPILWGNVWFKNQEYWKIEKLCLRYTSLVLPFPPLAGDVCQSAPHILKWVTLR